MRGSLLLSIALFVTSVPIAAQTSIPAGTNSPSATNSCVDVSVNDHPALSYACLNQRLAESAGAAAGPSVQLDAVAHQPGNQQVGQFNFSTLSIRMGNALGKSVVPQRPPPAPPLPLFGVPPPAH